MENKSCDGVFSKMKKIFTNPRSCKYIDKFATIVDKHWNKGEHDMESELYYYTRSTSIPSSIPSYQSTVLDTTSDDSGVILAQNNAPQLPPRRTIVTRAVIEPAQPKLWNSTPQVQDRISSPQYLELSPQTYWGSTFQENSEDSSSDQSDRSSERRGNGDEYDGQVLKESIGLLKSTLDNGKIERNLERFRIYEDAILTDATEIENSFERTASERFVVNLFESRLSKRWKRKSVIAHSFDNKIQVINDETKEVTKEMPDVNQNDLLKQSVSDSDAMFHKLKRLRDVECVKMKEASNALRAIKAKPDRECFEELLAERILLETDLKYKLIVGKIRDVNYSEIEPSNSKHSATVTLSEFEYELTPHLMKNNEFSEFFILAISQGTELFMSKVMTATEDSISFNEKFTLKNLDDNFSIKVEVFSISIRTAKLRKTFSLLRKESKTFCPMFKIYYENVNTMEMQQSVILNSSFKSCGEFYITKGQIGENSFTIPHLPDESHLQKNVNLTLKADLELNSNISGFLTLGRKSNDDDSVFWERKWCSLDANLFSIYNYPQDQEYGRPPVTTINLEYCFVPLVKHLKNFPRKKTFVLKTGRPSTINDSNSTAFRKRNNFVLEKYYFGADNIDDFERWTTELSSVLECLNDWERKKTFLLKTGRLSTINDSNSTAFRKRNNFVLEKYYSGADNIDDFERWTTELSSVLECLNNWERMVLV
ncbi:hypothetical protein JTB14_028137 [Gonioctena quinquepunctata]|nr:hypothetical protein JTB14_028137 [Gonioctena quinquepunctata]